QVMVRGGGNVSPVYRNALPTQCVTTPALISVRSIRRVAHTHKCLSIEIGDILVIVSILGVFGNAAHLGASESMNAPLVWGLLNAACAGFAVVGGLRRNPVMLIPYMVTLIIDIVTASACIVLGLFTLLSPKEESVDEEQFQVSSSPPQLGWWNVGRLSAVVVINTIFFYICKAARGVFRAEQCRKECCVLPLPYRSPPTSHRSHSSRSNSSDSAYETIGSVSMQVPIKFRMDQPPPYRSRQGSGNSDKITEKRKSSLTVVPMSQKRLLPSLRLTSLTESHNELYQNTWHGATVPAGRSPSGYSMDSIFNEQTPRHSYPIARQGYRHVSITESNNELYANSSPLL
ncbi:hypothetical protein PFISCL1PPCAC_24524, partial [Pristionchus fissidentatus]